MPIYALNILKRRYYNIISIIFYFIYLQPLHNDHNNAQINCSLLLELYYIPVF